VLDVRRECNFTDYFIICSADSPQQMKAVAQYIQEKLRETGVRQDHLEGDWDASWVLLDYGDFIVHIFQQAARSFYNLEELWNRAAKIEL